ncbi:MAG: sulfatase-like hydrolase/transferase [Flavobacteriaceae bacterium]|nr:sulfatase-like hydrolase/transferase [Flavobacteriaceae bacterium]MDH3795827.1 sulfatase-like hydrolase/transferase [Flavobacteriaceae bacterium]
MNLVKTPLIILLWLLIASCTGKQNETKGGNNVTTPNIILIVADDLGYADIGAVKLADDVLTPNIDRLVESGIRFAQAYDNSPICNQSRIGIITGSYPQRLGSYWYSAEGLHDPRFKTIPELLKQQKYQSGYIGKIHYGDHDNDSTHRSFPLNHGFDYYFGHTSARKHYMNHKKEIEEAFLKVKKEYNRKGQTLRQGSLWENKERVDTIAYFTELVGEKSRQFIKKNKGQKFFLQIAFNAAHNFTHQLPQEYLDKYNLKGYHDWNPAVEEYYDWYAKGRYPNNEEGRAHYLGQVHYMDKEIGKLLDLLEEQNLRENTLIFFISDNGGSTPIYANNTPLRGSKYLLYEGGIRVQMLVSYPKKYEKGKVYQNMVSAMDILPSICKEANIEIPGYIDGMDLTPLLRGKNDSLQHDVLFWDTGHELAVRKGPWKLRKSFNDEEAKYEMVELELGEFLHNLNNDVGEKTNLIKEESMIMNDLEKEYSTWKSHIEKGDNNE